MKPLQKIQVKNCPSLREWGETVKNQFEITIKTKAGTQRIFQSYDKVICLKDEEGQVWLDKKNWEYSRTTAKYRNQFLHEDTATVRDKVKCGIYKLVDLN